MSILASDLFSGIAREPIRLATPQADVMLYSEFLARHEADEFLCDLVAGVSWKQEKISFYGKQHNVPRLTAWYGDPGTTYAYSGIRVVAESWLPVLLAIKQRVEQVRNAAFNSVLCNHYRDGVDSVAWHSDDEPELGPEPVIASVSLGHERKFQMKHKTNPALKRDVMLTHGSLLLMRGSTQKNWMHRVPKSALPMSVRVNLTYRVIGARDKTLRDAR